MQAITEGSKFSYSVDAGAGKKIQVVPEGNTSLFVVQFDAGGQLPSSLNGKFTSMQEGIKAVQRYLEERAKRPPSRGGAGKAGEKPKEEAQS